jgi:hypothetical protein
VSPETRLSSISVFLKKTLAKLFRRSRSFDKFIGCFQIPPWREFARASTVTPEPIKALACLCLFPPLAEKPKPPALRVVGDSAAVWRGKGCFISHAHFGF